MHADPGIEPATQAYVQPLMEPTTFWCMGDARPTEPPGQGYLIIIITILSVVFWTHALFHADKNSRMETSLCISWSPFILSICRLSSPLAMSEVFFVQLSFCSMVWPILLLFLFFVFCWCAERDFFFNEE